LHQPDKDPSKFFGGQDLVQLYYDASKAVSVDFAWAPWFAFVNDNFNKQIDALFSGKMTAKQALDAWQNELSQECQRRRLPGQGPVIIRTLSIHAQLDRRSDALP
jgi:multiple sugar transport system substrate-binding protein